MHAHIVPPMDRTLAALAGLLAKAEAHCEAKGIKPEALLTFRLFPDMFPLTRQVQLTCDFCARAAARLAGAEPKSFPDCRPGSRRRGNIWRASRPRPMRGLQPARSRSRCAGRT